MVLDQLDGQRRLADATATDDHQFVLGHCARERSVFVSRDRKGVVWWLGRVRRARVASLHWKREEKRLRERSRIRMLLSSPSGHDKRKKNRKPPVRRGNAAASGRPRARRRCAPVRSGSGGLKASNELSSMQFTRWCRQRTGRRLSGPACGAKSAEMATKRGAASPATLLTIIDGRRNSEIALKINSLGNLILQ